MKWEALPTPPLSVCPKAIRTPLPFFLFRREREEGGEKEARSKKGGEEWIEGSRGKALLTRGEGGKVK